MKQTKISRENENAMLQCTISFMLKEDISRVQSLLAESPKNFRKTILIMDSLQKQFTEDWENVKNEYVENE